MLINSMGLLFLHQFVCRDVAVNGMGAGDVLYKRHLPIANKLNLIRTAAYKGTAISFYLVVREI